MGNYFLSAAELAATRVKIGKVNKRAERRGFTGRFELTATPGQRTVTTQTGGSRSVSGFEVTLTGTAPCYEGWTFVAAVDKTDAGAVIRTAPGVVEVPNDSIKAGVCEHCGTTRPRRHTYLVRDFNGTLKQVGKTCLKDFLGWNAYPVFIDLESVEEDLLGSFEGWGGRSFDFQLIDLARVVFAATDTFGYARATDPRPTRDLVATILDYRKGAEELLEQIADRFLEDEQVLERLTIVRESLTAPTGFEANLATILAGEVVERQHLGLAATVGLVYGKAVAAALVDETSGHESQWIGAVGDRVEVAGVVAQVTAIQGYYGTTLLVLLEAGDGDRVKMFTTAGWADVVEIGEAVKVAGVVKAHEEYDGRRETVLKRPKRIDD